MSIVDEKCENLLSEMGGNIADEKSERLLFEWTVQIGKVSIFFEINVADEKSEHLCFHLVFKMAVSLSTQLPSSPCSFYNLVWNKV